MLYKNMCILENDISVTKQGRMPFTYSHIQYCENISKIQYRFGLLDIKIIFQPQIQYMEGNPPVL